MLKFEFLVLNFGAKPHQISHKVMCGKRGPILKKAQLSRHRLGRRREVVDLLLGLGGLDGGDGGEHFGTVCAYLNGFEPFQVL